MFFAIPSNCIHNEKHNNFMKILWKIRKRTKVNKSKLVSNVRGFANGRLNNDFHSVFWHSHFQRSNTNHNTSCY